jgi:hypothetical protein
MVESVLALIAIGLGAAILIGSLLERPESSAARLPNLLPPAPTTTSADTVADPTGGQPASDGDLRADPAAGATPPGNGSRLLAGAAALALGLALAVRALGRDRAEAAGQPGPDPPGE